MAGSNDKFFRAEHVTFKLFQDSKNLLVLGKSWSVEENATEIADSVNGENRDRLDKVTNYYSGDVEIYQKDQAVMKAYMDAQDIRDAAGLPKTQSCSIFIKHRDGTTAAYILTEALFGPISTGGQGRSDAVMLKMKVRFRYMKPIPTLSF